MKNKTLYTALIIILIILALAGLFIFNWYQSEINKNRPAITSISPTSVLTGTPGIDLRVYGRNLETNSVINWNGSPVATDSSFISLGFLKATIPASNLVTAGKYNITITNSQKNKGTSNPVQFQIILTSQLK